RPGPLSTFEASLLPALAQVALAADELVGEAADHALHLVRVRRRGLQDEGRRTAEVERDERAQELLVRERAAGVRDGEVRDAADPRRVGKTKRLGRGREGYDLGQRLRSERLLPDLPEVTRGLAEDPEHALDVHGHGLEPHPVREAEERHLARALDLVPAIAIGPHEV